MESLEQKYAQTLEVSNLSLKQRRVLLSSLKLFSEIDLKIQRPALLPNALECQKELFLVTLKQRKVF